MSLDGFDSKLALKSKTVIGGAIATLPALIEIANQLAGIPVLPPKVAAGVSLFGGFLAIVGRFLARFPITLL